jgi:hypothetical protein
MPLAHVAAGSNRRLSQGSKYTPYFFPNLRRPSRARPIYVILAALSNLNAFPPSVNPVDPVFYTPLCSSQLRHSGRMFSWVR